jgi:hypothetical protein
MRSKRGLEQLISERWPKLKKRAQRQRNPEKLISVLEEIDDLLCNIEMKVAAPVGRTDSRDDMGATSGCRESGAILSEKTSGIRSE